MGKSLTTAANRVADAGGANTDTGGLYWLVEHGEGKLSEFGCRWAECTISPQ
jgi:hypothetical protein